MNPKTVRAIIKKGNRYLLVQRAEGDIGGGYWQFVGGHTDNQTPIDAVKREVKEEVGLTVTKVKGAFSFVSPHHGKTTRYFFVSAKGKLRLQESEIQDAKYFTKEQLRKLPLSKGAQVAIGRL